VNSVAPASSHAATGENLEMRPAHSGSRRVAPIGRLAKAEEVVALTCYPACLNQASFITEVPLVVDGGLYFAIRAWNAFSNILDR